MSRKKTYRILVEACRIVLALTFIFSGFVKSVDPWGTAIKMGEYFAAFNMDWLHDWRFFFAIWLTGAEMMLGCMVLFKVRLKLTSILITAAMVFFTALTFGLAVWNPVEDCGCFGDAIKLTNWETFIKNMILLPMSLLVYWDSRRKSIIPTWRDLFFMLLFACISFGIGLYSYLHLPLIDFLPYKEGTDLAAEVYKADEEKEVETIVIVRNIETGKKHEFDIEDTTWCDESVWEYIDIKNTVLHTRVHPTVRDFAVIDAEGNLVTDSVLFDPGVVFMICASDFDDIRPRCAGYLESAVRRAAERGYRVICLTAESLERHPELVLGDEHVPCYNMDATTLKTMLRAKVGTVVLRAGVIVSKENCRDMFDRTELPRF